jgi:proline iminopeptidase
MMMKRFWRMPLGAGIFTLLLSCGELLKPDTPGLLVPKTADQDATIPSIAVNNTQLHSEAFGNPNDPMLIILHGGPGGDYRSLLNCKDLAAQGYLVVFYDQRGSGLSQRHSHLEYSIEVMLNDLEAVINYYRTSPSQKIYLFGISWGAMLATAYINKNPHTISGAMLAEPGGFTYEDMKGYVARTREWKIDEATNDAFYTDSFLTGSYDEQEILDYKFALTAAYSFAPGNTEGIEGPTPFWRYGFTAQNALFTIAQREGFNFTTHLKEYDTEVLFLYSQNNKAYGAAYAAHVSSAYAHVDLQQVTGTGHKMVYFAWPQMRSRMLTYLQSHN